MNIQVHWNLYVIKAHKILSNARILQAYVQYTVSADQQNIVF